jgi:hypothetical protein
MRAAPYEGASLIDLIESLHSRVGTELCLYLPVDIPTGAAAPDGFVLPARGDCHHIPGRQPDTGTDSIAQCCM